MEKDQHQRVSLLSLPSGVTFCLLLLAALLLAFCHRKTQRSGSHMASLLNWFGAMLPLRRRASGGKTRRGLSIQVTDCAVAHRALVRHSAAFLDRPTGTVPSTILTRSRHYNILASPYGASWRALRRNLVAGTLHPSGFRLLATTRASILGALVQSLESGATAAESLHFALFSLSVIMCFGEDVVAALGETRLREIEKLHWDIILALPSFGVFIRYQRIGKFLYPFRWRQMLAFRRQQEEVYLPLIAEVKDRKAGHASDFLTYVESLLDLRIHEDGDRMVTNGELVSLVSEFVGSATESTAAALQWTMANLAKHPDLQQKLRQEVDAIGCGDNVMEEAELSCMPYLKAVVFESLRRHPTVPFVLRHVKGEEAAKALGRASLPDGGATANFLVGKIGRDPSAWSEPMAFSPERFMPGGDGEGVDLTCTRELRMMPFGAGRRACTGLATAMLNLEYFVANLVREFEWWEVVGDEVDLTESRGFFFTVMERPLRARVVRRDAATGLAK